VIASEWFPYKSPIVNTNDHLSEILDSFTPFYFIFSPGSRLVDQFSKNITFYSLASLDDEDVAKHIDNLNNVFHQSQIYPYATTIIKDRSVRKTNTTTSVTVIWKDHNVIKQSCINDTNITPIKAELMAICLELSYSLSDNDNCNIIIITDLLTMARKIVKSYISSF